MILLVIACTGHPDVEHRAQVEGRTDEGYAFVAHADGPDTFVLGTGDGIDEYALEDGFLRVASYPNPRTVLDGGLETFAASSIGAVATFRTGETSPAWVAAAPELSVARLTADGSVLGLSPACELWWLRDQIEATQVVAERCRAFAADPVRSLAYLADNDGIVTVTEDGAVARLSDTLADRLTWSPDGHLYAAEIGGQTLFALDNTTGEVAWSLPFDGGIRLLSARGDDGVAVVTEVESFLELIVVKRDGARLASVAMPDGPTDLLFSAEGHSFVIVLPGAVHLFELDR